MTQPQTHAQLFVSGGTGFLGRHLVPMLCRAGYQVRVLARDPSAHEWLSRLPRVEIVPGNVRDSDSVVRGMAGCDYVIHAAGLFRFWGDARDFEATNVGGTENMLRAASEAGVKRFVHMSTAAVIGQPEPDAVVDEQSAPHPADAYQQSKLAGEMLVRRYASERGLSAIILRPGAFYGPLGTYAFNRLFFRDPMRGIIMQVNGGRYITFPAYIGDVASAATLALTRGESGEVYNICGDPITHREAFDIILKEGNIWYPRLSIPGWMGVWTANVLTVVGRLIGREPFYPTTLRSYVYNYWNVSSEKARRELGFAPIDFREGVRRTLAWYRAGQPEHIAELDYTEV